MTYGPVFSICNCIAYKKCNSPKSNGCSQRCGSKNSSHLSVLTNIGTENHFWYHMTLFFEKIWSRYILFKKWTLRFSKKRWCHRIPENIVGCCLGLYSALRCVPQQNIRSAIQTFDILICACMALKASSRGESQDHPNQFVLLQQRHFLRKSRKLLSATIACIGSS